jgi:hypothetical protein
MISIGPWMDQYYPVSTFVCKDGPPAKMRLPFFVGQWWGHDPAGMKLVGDGSVLSGSYSAQVGPGTATWTWSFRQTGRSARRR